jgi:hypothetical protein
MIERCMDYRRIKKLVTWPLVISSKIIYLIQSDNGTDQGVWSFEPDGEGVKGHADIGTQGKGRKAVEGAKECIRWIFKNTEAAFVSAGIPVENKPACCIAAWSGMKSLGIKNNIREFKITR